MSKTTRRGIMAGAIALAFGFNAILPVAQAASISYGTVSVGGVSFTAPPAGGIRESSGTDNVPLYGTPSPFSSASSVGLNFQPTFVSSSAGGGADLTDGQLNFTIMTSNPLGIPSLTVNEGGDYTLIGAGTAATQVFAGLIVVNTKITEVNGSTLSTPVTVNANGSASFNLLANPGQAPWGLSVTADFAAALAGAGISGVATKVEVAINNTLAAISEPTSVALIAKKGFEVRVPIVPEPASTVMIGSILCGLGLAGRRK